MFTFSCRYYITKVVFLALEMLQVRKILHHANIEGVNVHSFWYKNMQPITTTLFPAGRWLRLGADRRQSAC